MAKLYAYYIINAKAELKYVYQDLSEKKFYEKVKKHLFEHLAEDDIVKVEDDYDYDDDEDKINNEDKDEDGTNNNSEIDEYLNLVFEELRQLLEIQIVKEMKTALETDFRYIAMGNDFEELNIDFRKQL
ncbi:hypothetical protein C1645_817430 [Glomus cerebriforme]|uniref:Uncharacterized protein n=1 Tax=Glomus cerebriforme TaxID=658196 RepID=A0A397TEE5_9GLOM|nr:hypothetical protein C1645_817430 [Glomus cerebriforme]